MNLNEVIENLKKIPEYGSAYFMLSKKTAKELGYVEGWNGNIFVEFKESNPILKEEDIK